MRSARQRAARLGSVVLAGRCAGVARAKRTTRHSGPIAFAGARNLSRPPFTDPRPPPTGIGTTWKRGIVSSEREGRSDMTRLESGLCNGGRTSAGALAAVLLWFVLMRPVALAQALSGLH